MHGHMCANMYINTYITHIYGCMYVYVYMLYECLHLVMYKGGM